MKLRLKLELLSTAVVAAVLIVSSLAIYFLSADFRGRDYLLRLQTKAVEVSGRYLANEKLKGSEDLGDNMLGLVDEQILILDYRNNIVFNSNPDINREFPKKFFNKIRIENSASYKHEGAEAVGIVFTSATGRNIVIVSAYDKYGFSKLYNLRLVLIIVSLFMLGFAFLISHILTRRALKPVNQLMKETERISASSLDQRLTIGGEKDEIGQIAGTFNKMLDRLETSFEMQRNFMANASHELRTPLTAITGQIEVALLKERTADEYEATLSSILEDIRSLSELTNGLLDLAQSRLDNKTNKPEFIRLDEVIWQARADLLKGKPEYEIEIIFETFPEEESGLIACGYEQLLKTAFTNLMSNACKFSADQRAEVCLRFKPEGFYIIFKDQGIGIPQEEIATIFQPFHRASNALHIKGHGLGMPLTRKIVLLHKGSIKIKSEVGKGTEIEVFIPKIID